jgi:hypothetical protein
MDTAHHRMAESNNSTEQLLPAINHHRLPFFVFDQTQQCVHKALPLAFSEAWTKHLQSYSDRHTIGLGMIFLQVFDSG